MRLRRVRPGFTLIELLTVIAIISILVSILLPAVQRAREVANRLRCSSNMRQIGIAMHNYESAKGTMPPAGLSFDATGTAYFDTTPISTFTALLPFLEAQDTYNLMDTTTYYNATAGNKAAAKTSIHAYLCPTNPIRQRAGVDSFSGGGYGVTDYMPVAATSINPAVASGNLVNIVPGLAELGALRVPAAPQYVISDGLSKTIGIIEATGRSEYFFTAKYDDPVGVDLFAPGAVAGGLKRNSFRWAEPASAGLIGGPPGAKYPWKMINNNSTPFGGPTGGCVWTLPGCGPNDQPFSFHGGGVNALFMDGHVSFIRDDIDALAFRRLLTSQEGQPSGYVE